MKGKRLGPPAKPEDKLQDFVALGEVLEALFKGRQGLHPEVLKLWKIWPDIMGPELSQVAKPSTFKRGVLTIKVTDPIWLQELNLKRDEILNSIKERIPDNLITELRFQLGRY